MELATPTTPSQQGTDPGVWRPQPRPLTPSRKRILELLHQYRYLTPRLLTLAYSWREGSPGRGLSHIRHELGELCREGLVARPNEGARAALANEELVYVLTPTGAKAILGAPEYSRARHLIYRRNDRGRRGNFRHHLALSELQMVLEIGSTEWNVEQFVTDERRSRFRLRLPAIDVPGAGPLGQVRSIGGEERGLQPDARALIRFPSGQRTLLLFDVDVQRRANARTDERTLAYHVLVSRQLDEIMTTFAVNNAVVVFVLPNERALEQLRLRAQHVVRAGRAAARLVAQPLFLFWDRGGWFTKETLRRRQYVGTSRERERVWTVRILRDPRDILSASGLETLTGKRRRLIQQRAGPLPSNRDGLR